MIDAELADRAPPARWRETIALVLLVALCDVTMYRRHGFAGYAMLFAVAPALLWLASPWRHVSAGFRIVYLMLALAAAKMVWSGSGLIVAAGFALIVAFAMTLCGMRPYILALTAFAIQAIAYGYHGLRRQWQLLSQARHGPRSALRQAQDYAVHPSTSSGLHGPRTAWLNVVLPLIALVGFGILFILANPDLAAWFGEYVSNFVANVQRFLIDFGPSPREVAFWFAVLWVALGLVRPVWRGTDALDVPADGRLPPVASTPAVFYPALRNTLVAVIVLFAAYLAFEFKTLWFRVFPQGFYYSGYAHEGAAWLTTALALATAVLSLIFCGKVLGDPRLPHLRRLAWWWSLENILLAAAVYHRLFI